MKLLKKSLDLKALGIELPNERTPEDHLLENLMILVDLANSQGLSKAQHIYLGRIAHKWAQTGTEIELTEPEYDLLRKSVEDARPPANAWKLANAIYELFELT